LAKALLKMQWASTAQPMRIASEFDNESIVEIAPRIEIAKTFTLEADYSREISCYFLTNLIIS
jgi:hypothetical protein